MGITEETSSGVYYNVYYNPNTHPNEVPQNGWIVYKGQYSRPGVRPLPKVKVLVAGHDMQNDSSACFCYDWQDIHMPHRHKTSPVDLAVKSIVVEGAFRLLQQVRQGVQEPNVDAYIPVDIMGTDLYGLLSS